MNAHELYQTVARRLCDPATIEALAKHHRKVWEEYASSTLSNPPPAFIKPWEETTEWSKEGNREAARRTVQEVLALVLPIFEEEFLSAARQEEEQRKEDRP